MSEKTMQERTIRKPTMAESLVAVLGMAVIIGVGMLVLKMRVEFCMILSATLSLLLAMRLGYRWSDIEEAISHRLAGMTPTILIIWSIGMLIGAMLYSGSIPMIIYYGFNLINPQFIYLGAFLACATMSIVTGTSWGSAGTVGVACMALAGGLGASLPMAAGAVIAGSVFGDKLSPMSETTNLAPACAGTDLYTHIKSQLWTTIPATIVCIVLYAILGFNFSAGGGGAIPETALAMREQLNAIYNWNIILLLPFAVILAGALLKKPVVPTIMISCFLCLLMGMFIQNFSVSNGTIAMIRGFTTSMVAPEGMEIHSVVNTLMNRGGMASMGSIVIICYCGFASTAILTKTGFMDKALEPLMRNLNSRAKTMLTAEIAVFFIHALAGTSYVSSIFVGEAYKKPFIKNGMGLPCLSRTLEDVGTCVSCMFPWGTSGAFYLTTLGVSAWGAEGYMPYTVLPFACPLFAFILAVIGVGISKLSPEEIEVELAKLDKDGVGTSLSDIAS